MGTVISLRHLQRIEAMVSRRGTNTQILAGGERMLGTSSLDEFDFAQGNFFAPTVIANVDIQDELWQEEIFGPVVVVKSFEVTIMRKSFFQAKHGPRI
jgi:acyl-CoA reductase-like NAD-dependent aldehyde dehydrogenase